ncbi:MAG: LysR substrate-binding domain-containing protein [Polyangia bacterium]
MRDLDPSLLGTFLAVLDAGRISAAAKAIHLSQPAVTAQIRKLEDALGASLFVRSVHGVTPTERGLRLETYARSMRVLLAEAIADVAATEEQKGPLVVAASTTIAAHVLPFLLAAFRAQHPTVPLDVHVENTEHVVEEVRSGRVPLGLVEGHARASGVRLEPFIDDEIVPVMGREATFTVKQARDLEHVPLLWREAGSGTRAVVERALVRAGVRRKKVRALDVELGSTEAILGGAVAGLGLAFVSRRSARAHLDAGLVRLVPGLALVVQRTFRWALPTGSLSGPAASFYALARRTPLG